MISDGYTALAIALDGHVATVTIARPDQRNAIDRDTHAELERVWVDLAANREVRAIVLTGAGDCFSTGGDIVAMAERAGTERAFTHALGIGPSTRRLFTNILATPQPIVAAINGHATGLGATLALFADLCVISETARFGDTHVNVGLVAGDGGAVIWPLLVGANKAKEMLMLARLITGREAQALGLAAEAVPAGEVLARAQSLAAELAAKPPLAVQWTKLAINRGIQAQMDLVLDASLAWEMLSMASDDHREATQAIVEKRQPKFTGR